METIERENEFAKLHLVDGFLVTGAKKRFLKLGYNYSYFSSAGIPTIEKVKLKVPVMSIKKMRILGMGIVFIVFFLLAVFSFGMGFVRGIDQETGEQGPTHIAAGTIIAVILTALGILYLRSKMGRVKVLQTSIGGNLPMLVFASLDIAELKALRELIKKQQQTIIEQPSLQPPPLPKT